MNLLEDVRMRAAVDMHFRKDLRMTWPAAVRRQHAKEKEDEESARYWNKEALYFYTSWEGRLT